MAVTGDQESGVRGRMIRSAIIQLAKHGLQGASFAEILAHAQAPRGSVYHHFPGGKSELISAALEHMATHGLAPLDDLEGAPVEDLVRGFVAMWRSLLERSDFAAGCSITGVTVTADTVDLLDQAATVFAAWRARLTDLLAVAGLDPAATQAFAIMMLASTEGAVVLARANRSLEPLAAVEAQLLTLSRTLQRDRAT